MELVMVPSVQEQATWLQCLHWKPKRGERDIGAQCPKTSQYWGPTWQVDHDVEVQTQVEGLDGNVE